VLYVFGDQNQCKKVEIFDNLKLPDLDLGEPIKCDPCGSASGSGYGRLVTMLEEMLHISSCCTHEILLYN
jgi:hypothetical protein